MREVGALKDFCRYAKANPVSSSLGYQLSGTSLSIYGTLGDSWNRRLMIKPGLSRRVPLEISKADGLVITAMDDRACHNRHRMVSVNGVELCPVMAMLLLAAAKNYFWSDGLEAAISKILEVSRNES